MRLFPHCWLSGVTFLVVDREACSTLPVLQQGPARPAQLHLARPNVQSLMFVKLLVAGQFTITARTT